MFTCTRCLGFLVAVAFAICAQSNAAVVPPSVHVFSCVVVSGPLLPNRDDVGLLVRFQKRGSTLSSITWRVKYGKSKVDVLDDGEFSPKVRIDNYASAEQGSTHVNLLAAAIDASAIATGHVADLGLMIRRR